MNTKKVKEIQFGIDIGTHDLDIKLNHMTEFLKQKHNVRLILTLKNRDMKRIKEAESLMERVVEKVKDRCKILDKPKISGKKIIAVCHPL